MMTISVGSKTAVLSALGLLLACACSDGAAPEPAETAESESREEAEGAYQRPIDKAREVEDQLQDAAEKHERDIEEQEGGG